MASEIRLNSLKNRVGLGTVSFADTGIIVSGIVTCTELSGLTALNIAGVGTANTLDINGDIDVDGHTELDRMRVTGVSTFTNFIEAGSTGSGGIKVGSNLFIQDQGNVMIQNTGNGSMYLKSLGTSLRDRNNNTIINASEALGARLYHTGGSTQKLGTSATGINILEDLDVDGHTELDNVNIAGVVTATTFKGALQGTSGTFSSNVDITGDLDVDGHTDLDNVSVAGVVTATTFVGALTGNASGNAATATALQNARTIGGVSFDGTANINLPGVNASGNQDTSGTAAVATRVTLTDQSADTTCNVLFAQGATGNQLPHTGTNLTFNSSTGQLNATKFVGDGSGLTGITASGSGVVIKHDGSTVGTAGTINFSTNLDVSAISAGIVTITAADTQLSTEEVQDIVGAMFSGNTETNISATYQDSDGTIDLVATGSYANSDVDSHLNVSGASSGQILSWNGSDYAWVADQTGGGTNVGITTNLSGTFTASAGSPSTINTFGYGSGDIVVEYTVFIKNGSNYQSQKLLAMRDGTTIHSTQFAIMYSSSLLVQLDTTISSGNILLRATPETGVSGSTTYKVKREVM